MSSESSSRLRQFGLHKTIDSQTAEFLKLSRKRQIRRGCACAAVSSAITVTVVVGALLIYEFGFRPDYKTTPEAHRPFSWFNVVNDSNAPFDKHNSPIKLKNNGKLLAIILKSLDQKRYLETFVDENSSQNPSQENTKDYHFQKYVIDAKNRKIEYKPSRDIQNKRKDSLEKAKNVMDYQRVIHYLNSMSFNKDADETVHFDDFSTQQPTTIETKIKEDMFQQNKQTSSIDANQARNANNEEKVPSGQCSCPNRSTLTDILEKLYASIQRLGEKLNENKLHNTKVKKYRATSATTIVIKKKRTKTKTTPRTKSIIPTTSASVIVSNDTEKANNSSYKEELAPWKEDLENTAYDGTSSVYIQTKQKNNSESEVDAVSDVTEAYTQTSNDDQYDFDDKIEESSQNIQYSTHTNEENTKRSEIVHNNELENYLNGLSKLTTMIVNTPQTPAPYMSVEKLKDKLWDLKQFLNCEISDRSKVASSSSEIPQTQEATKSLDETTKQTLLYPIAGDKAAVRKYVSDLFMKEIREKPNYRSEHVTFNVNEKSALTPMMQTFLLSKKESGFILNAGETSTAAVQLQIDSAEDLPFNFRFDEDEVVDHFISLKTTRPSYIADQIYKKYRSFNGNKKISGEKARAIKPFKYKYHMEDDYLNSLQEYTTISIKSLAKDKKTKKKSVTEIIKRQKARTKAPSNLDSFDDNIQFLSVKENKTSLTKAKEQYHRIWEKDGSMAKVYVKPADMHATSKAISSTRKARKKKKKNKSRIELSEPSTSTTIATEAPKVERKKQKIKEIFYMTGNDTPVDDFDSFLPSLSSLIYANANPVNYTALAESFLNQVEEVSSEKSKSMMPDTRPSHLEIRRNHEFTDLYNNWFNNDEQTFASFNTVNFD